MLCACVCLLFFFAETAATAGGYEKAASYGLGQALVVVSPVFFFFIYSRAGFIFVLCRARFVSDGVRCFYRFVTDRLLAVPRFSGVCRRS